MPGAPVYLPVECIGSVVNGVCHGTTLPQTVEPVHYYTVSYSPANALARSLTSAAAQSLYFQSLSASLVKGTLCVYCCQ